MKKIILSAILFAFSINIYAAPTIADDFSGKKPNLPWVSLGSACLTAGDGSGTIPACNKPYNGTNGGFNGTIPDAVGVGALRLTDDVGSQSGAVIYPYNFASNQGLQVLFTTYIYSAVTNPSRGQGGDGIGFFILDGTLPAPTATGPNGGSLGYTCSNSNYPADGIVGGYVGIGIDNFGNFSNSYDATATGGATIANRISLRGAGTVTKNWVTTNYPALYPTLTDDQLHTICHAGKLSDGTSFYDYQYISGITLPTTQPLSSESYSSSGVYLGNYGFSRTNATPVTYKIQITTTGLMSMQYSYNGGSWQSLPYLDPASPFSLLSNSISGKIPSSFRFGFSASTGAAVNIQEIGCFSASSLTSNTSAASNTTQGQQLKSDSQIYVGSYDPNTFIGHLLSYSLVSSGNNISVASSPNWDANCVLTGGICRDPNGNVISSASETSAQRYIISSNGVSGIPFAWASLNAAQQTSLGGSTTGPVTLSYLAGVRTAEVGNVGGTLRYRQGLMGDIVDSSPALVTYPNSGFPTVWSDSLYLGSVIPENSGQSYSNFATLNASRLNVVYVGANDGMFHGFETGSYIGNSYNTAKNDGKEVLAYVPNNVYPSLSNLTKTVYSHTYYADGSPYSSDIYYAGAWHTWVVSGLGSGGKSIFALDVSNPDTFSSSSPSSIFKGEWDSSTLSNLGNLYGNPIIRRMHNGQWAVIFGNGNNSANGLAGVYVVLINSLDGTVSKSIFMSTGAGSLTTPNGINYVESSDMDKDHITDYIYAGDLLGNLWRFDVTSQDSTLWAASKYGNATASPLINVGNPITTKPIILYSGVSPNIRAIVSFGSGQYVPVGLTDPATYAPGSQAMYGVWDYDMSQWNILSGSKYLYVLPTQSITSGNLQAQKIVPLSGGQVGLSNNSVNWCLNGSVSSTCIGSGSQLGWTVDLTPLSTTVSNSQVIYNPIFAGGAIVDNITSPPVKNIISCSTIRPVGWTVAFNPLTGGSFASSFISDSAGNFNYFSVGGITYAVMGAKTNAVGVGNLVSTRTGSSLVSGNTSGTGISIAIKPVAVTKGKRLTWRQLR